MNNITALYCKNCNNIIYSRYNHDFRRCDCGKIAIDARGERFIGNISDFEILELGLEQMINFIFEYDYLYGNRYIKPEFTDGYYGKFRLAKNSNPRFYRKLVTKNRDALIPFFAKNDL